MGYFGTRGRNGSGVFEALESLGNGAGPGRRRLTPRELLHNFASGTQHLTTGERAQLLGEVIEDVRSGAATSRAPSSGRTSGASRPGAGGSASRPGAGSSTSRPGATGGRGTPASGGGARPG